jgi:hypothetical protein
MLQNTCIPRLQYIKDYIDSWTDAISLEYASNMRILRALAPRPWLFIWQPQPFKNARIKKYNLYGTGTITVPRL